MVAFGDRLKVFGGDFGPFWAILGHFTAIPPVRASLGGFGGVWLVLVGDCGVWEGLSTFGAGSSHFLSTWYTSQGGG